MAQTRGSHAVGWGAGFLAGVGAGIVAAVACYVLALVTHTSIPPARPTVASAFVAGVLGGLVYAAWGRVVSRPVLALWITTLALATVISAAIATLPFPATRLQLPIPILGLVIPLQQLAALVGLGQFGKGHFPTQFLPATITMHYLTAVSVSLLVPWWAGRRRA